MVGTTITHKTKLGMASLPDIDDNFEYARVYPQEIATKDLVGDEGFLYRVMYEFGQRAMRGTAITFEDIKGRKMYGIEQLFRDVIKGSGKAVEIGTFRGVSTAVMAHYYDRVDTIDVIDDINAMLLWQTFGVSGKISYWTVHTNQAKKDICDEREFSLAFVDGSHLYDDVKFDFECVKKCGHVVFHDYGFPSCPGVTKFINELPKGEVEIRMPFAIWRAT